MNLAGLSTEQAEDGWLHVLVNSQSYQTVSGVCILRLILVRILVEHKPGLSEFSGIYSVLLFRMYYLGLDLYILP